MSPKKKPPSNSKPPLNNIAKYSGIGFQMVVLIFLGIWGGMKIDAALDLKIPAFTLLLSLGGLGISLYVLIRSVLNDK